MRTVHDSSGQLWIVQGSAGVRAAQKSEQIMIVQDSAGQLITVQDSAGQCKTAEDSAGQMQGNAGGQC